MFILNSGLLCITNYLVAQEVKKLMIFDLDIVYFLKRFIPIALITILCVATTSQNNEKMEETHVFYDFYSVTVTTCGRRNWRFLVGNASQVYI